ncbi:unnamed protein product [Camellia sinensis]
MPRESKALAQRSGFAQRSPPVGGHGGEAGDDVDLPDGADVAVAVDEVAALDEVLVRLWVVEAADDGPDGGDGSGDVVDGGGAALVGTHGVSVVARDGVRHRSGAR